VVHDLVVRALVTTHSVAATPAHVRAVRVRVAHHVLLAPAVRVRVAQLVQVVRVDLVLVVRVAHVPQAIVQIVAVSVAHVQVAHQAQVQVEPLVAHRVVQGQVAHRVVQAQVVAVTQPVLSVSREVVRQRVVSQSAPSAKSSTT